MVWGLVAWNIKIGLYLLNDCRGLEMRKKPFGEKSFFTTTWRTRGVGCLSLLLDIVCRVCGVLLLVLGMSLMSRESFWGGSGF